MSWRLFIDVGNFAIKYGVREDGSWRATGSFLHGLECADDAAEARGMAADAIEELQANLEAVELALDHCKGAAVASSSIHGRAFIKQLRQEIPGSVRELKTGHAKNFRTKYRFNDLGIDRVANVLAARALYPLPAVVLDAGTCLTSEIIAADGTFLGGHIAGGMPLIMMGVMGLSDHLAEALAGTSARPSGIIGRNTGEAVAGGIALQMTGTFYALLGAAYDELGTEEISVILTGGDAEMLLELVEVDAVFNPLLTLEGLRLLDETD